MENTEHYTYEVISPKSLAEEMAVNLVKTGLKTKREATNIMEAIEKKGKSFASRIRDAVRTVKSVPNKIFSNIRMSLQNKIDTLSSELKLIKSNVSQRIDDIDKGRYEINRTTISINIPKPIRPKAREVAAATGMELITPKEMAQTLHENMTEIKQSARGVFHALGRLQSAVGKLLKNMSPIKHKETAPVVAAGAR